MSVSLIIERNDGYRRTEIAFAEWQNIVAADGDLRMAVPPVEVRNLKTSEIVGIAGTQGMAEICLDAKWLPFLA